MFVFALFMLKRGICQARPKLRQWALVIMFFCLIKVCAFDVRMLGRELLCSVSDELSEVGCNTRWLQGLQVLALVALVAGSLILFQVSRLYGNVKEPTTTKPADVYLSFWSNATLFCVSAMVVWQCAPWVGFLTIGYVPRIFSEVPWQWFAIFNLCLLLASFWVAENCNWNYEVKHKKRMAHLNATWTQRDTLWMCVFIYLATLALSYVAHDVLTSGGTRPLER